MGFTQEELNGKLLEAAKKEDVEEVQGWLEQGADINAVDYMQRTPLHIAAHSGNLAVVECLVKKEADVNAVDTAFKRMPIHYAAESGNVEVVKCLVKKGADVNAVDQSNKKAFHLAALQGHLGVLKFFIELGADISTADEVNQAIFQTAMKDGRVEIVNLLLEQDLSINFELWRENLSREYENVIKGITGDQSVKIIPIPQFMEYIISQDKECRTPIILEQLTACEILEIKLRGALYLSMRPELTEYEREEIKKILSSCKTKTQPKLATAAAEQEAPNLVSGYIKFIDSEETEIIAIKKAIQSGELFTNKRENLHLLFDAVEAAKRRGEREVVNYLKGVTEVFVSMLSPEEKIDLLSNIQVSKKTIMLNHILRDVSDIVYAHVASSYLKDLREDLTKVIRDLREKTGVITDKQLTAKIFAEYEKVLLVGRFSEKLLTERELEKGINEGRS